MSFEIDVTDSFQPTILRYDALPSTNTEAASQAARGAPEGLCIVAREQTRGRGRQERAWASPPGAGLYFSIVLRPRLTLAAWPLVTLMAALAARDALAGACALRTDIKWPNDILFGGRKLCGILAETVETPAGRACILGIGINLSEQAYPAELQARATSVEAATGTRVDPERVLAALVRSLAVRYAQLHAPEGQAEIIRDWSANSSYAVGKRVRVHAATEIFDGTTRGLEPDGALRVETATRDIRIVRAADVHALRETTNDGIGTMKEER
ncbi:MAG TPA: biotin--[acetyl-CoA-carboxylase] ligase [Pyrinomonadaceae bacterium]|nr:biotin--[acetyl-CoA-carboxylase] ligase [Pyrinomonadaceae bacterium]